MKISGICCSSDIFRNKVCLQFTESSFPCPGGAVLPGAGALKFGHMLCWQALTFLKRVRPLRRSRASSPKGRADTPGNFTGQPGTVPPPLKPSPTGGRWRGAPDEGQHQLPRRDSQGLKPIAKVLGIMRRLSAVLLALPLRKDFHPLRGKMSRSAFKIIPHKKAAAQNPVQQP